LRLLGMALGAWLIFGSLVDLAQRIALFRAPIGKQPFTPCRPFRAPALGN